MPDRDAGRPEHRPHRLPRRSYARINRFGFIETPYRKVEKGRVTDEIVYLAADDEDEYVIAQANAASTSRAGSSTSACSCVPAAARSAYVTAGEVDYMDVSPKQIVSVATALIPFLEHDDANRALMGANMQRQAVPLLRATAPYIGTGVEGRAPRATRATCSSRRTTARSSTCPATPSRSSTRTRRSRHHRLAKFRRSNQGTCINQKPIVVRRAPQVKKGDVLADGPSTHLRRARARQEPARRVHALEGSQLRGRDRPLASGS